MKQVLSTPASSSSSAPERIYGWLDSQLSIARFYGGITYQGFSYVIDTADPEHPLVRSDVLKAERKAKDAQNTKKRHAARDGQNDFFNEAQP